MTTQTAFRTALLDAAEPVPEGLSDGAGRPAGRRYSVYRNNVAVSLSDALATGFPVIAKLLGQENFGKIAGLYLRAEPPSSPLMMEYGAGFAEFLGALPQLAHLPYLRDVARLEYALRMSYHAADHVPADATPLQTLSEEALEATQFDLAPSLQLVRSPYPIVSIWKRNTLDGAPKPAPVAEDALITRGEFDPEPHVLPAGGADFVTALMSGQAFGPALAGAGDAFDLGATLGLLLGQGAITAITPPDQS